MVHIKAPYLESTKNKHCTLNSERPELVTTSKQEFSVSPKICYIYYKNNYTHTHTNMSFWKIVYPTLTTL